MSKILLAEDSQKIAAFVKKGLESRGYTVLHTPDGAQVLGELERENPDLLILDLGLPNKDGYEILDELRERGDEVPVLILTARDSVQDKVQGFELGADDYMSKPFELEELLARVRRRIRPRVDNPSVITHREITLNLLSRRVSVGDQSSELTTREFAMLEIFLRKLMTRKLSLLCCNNFIYSTRNP